MHMATQTLIERFFCLFEQQFDIINIGNTIFPKAKVILVTNVRRFFIDIIKILFQIQDIMSGKKQETKKRQEPQSEGDFQEDVQSNSEDHRIENDGQVSSEHSSINMEAYLRARDNIPDEPSDAQDDQEDEDEEEEEAEEYEDQSQSDYDEDEEESSEKIKKRANKKSTLQAKKDEKAKKNEKTNKK